MSANTRNEKLSEQIKAVIASTLERRVKDPRLGFVTLTEVSLTGDNREATVFYTVLGDQEAQAASAAALRSATGMLRTTVGTQLGLRHTPSLEFVRDAVPETAKEIDELLAKVQASDAELAKAAEESTFAGEADPYRKPREDDEE